MRTMHFIHEGYSLGGGRGEGRETFLQKGEKNAAPRNINIAVISAISRAKRGAFCRVSIRRRGDPTLSRDNGRRTKRNETKRNEAERRSANIHGMTPKIKSARQMRRDANGGCIKAATRMPREGKGAGENGERTG